MLGIDIVKTHLRVDFSDEDELIGLYIDAAITYTESFLDRSLIKSESDRKSPDDLIINDAVKAALLLTIGTLYANREQEITGSITAELKFGAKSLLMPYRTKLGIY